MSIKRIIIFSLIFSTLPIMVLGQSSNIILDSLQRELSQTNNDYSRLRLYTMLAAGSRFSGTEQSLSYSDTALMLAENLSKKAEYAQILSLKGATLLEVGKIPESLALQFESLKISEEVKDAFNTAIVLNRIGNTYLELGDYEEAKKYYFLSKDLFTAINTQSQFNELSKLGNIYEFFSSKDRFNEVKTEWLFNELSNIGNTYQLMGLSDSAMYYQQKVAAYIASDDFFRNGIITVPEVMFRMGDANKLKGDTLQALEYYKKGIAEASFDQDYRNLAMNNLLLAKLYSDLNQRDSSLRYSKAAFEAGNIASFRKGIYESAMLLSDLYDDINKYDSAYAYMKLANIQKDSLLSRSRFFDLQRIILKEQEQVRQSEAQAIEQKNAIKQNSLLAGLGVFLVIAFILYYNNRQKQKTNIVLESTLNNLKSTQAQLIQSEKMASLGELTAGIAHEIQNPLNFVNNFSEVSAELVEEIRDSRHKTQETRPKTEEDEIEDEILEDIKQNLEKINHHGKRADAIVKGMLEHSRTGSGEKELTDINNLAREYLNLAYQSFKSKNEGVDIKLITDLDPTIPKIELVRADIGKVLLNILNNAFYACTSTSISTDTSKFDIPLNHPTVGITTKNLGNTPDSYRVEISIKDNGPGIPDAIKSKIFQPFFTTKPTGQGTGLGLSLSYDIVKAHGGEIRVESLSTDEVGLSTDKVGLPAGQAGEEGKGTVFIITLPI
jgi:two-component system, NtrC family, sensor kinase